MLLIAIGLAVALIVADLYELALHKGARKPSGLGEARGSFWASARLGEGDHLRR